MTNVNGANKAKYMVNAKEPPPLKHTQAHTYSMEAGLLIFKLSTVSL